MVKTPTVLAIFSVVGVWSDDVKQVFRGRPTSLSVLFVSLLTINFPTLGASLGTGYRVTPSYPTGMGSTILHSGGTISQTQPYVSAQSAPSANVATVPSAQITQNNNTQAKSVNPIPTTASPAPLPVANLEIVPNNSAAQTAADTSGSNTITTAATPYPIAPPAQTESTTTSIVQSGPSLPPSGAPGLESYRAQVVPSLAAEPTRAVVTYHGNADGSLPSQPIQAIGPNGPVIIPTSSEIDPEGYDSLPQIVPGNMPGSSPIILFTQNPTPTA